VTEPTNPTSNSMMGWLKSNRIPIGLVIALIAALGAWTGLFSGTNVTIVAPEPTEKHPETDGPNDEAENSMRADEAKESLRVQDLYEVTRSRLHNSENFLFADYQYEDSGSGHRYGSVDVYAANQNTFAKVDHQSCSYPDGSKIQTDAEQGVLLVSCSFADWYRDRSDSDEEDYSYTVTVVRFFDSDTEFSVSLSCGCIGVTISSADLNVSEKKLYLTFFTTGTTVRVSDLDENLIMLPPVENDRSSGPARVIRLDFDQFWNLRSFDLLR